jgi:phospholipase/carboxylesterase
MSLNDLEFRLRPARGDPSGAFVLLHGRGADEHDLYPLFDILDPDRRLMGLTPRGPLTLPPGGAHWYVVRRVGYPDPYTFWPTYKKLCSWLDSLEAETGLPLHRTIVSGFSQGAVMSYAAGLGRGRPRPAALMCFSGFVPQVDGLEFDLDGRADLPVAVGHGIHDPVIDVDFGRRARALLEGAGIEVLYRESDMMHSLDPEFLAELRPWVGGIVEGFGG